LQSQSATNEFSKTCRGRFLRARSVQPVGLVVHEDLLQLVDRQGQTAVFDHCLGQQEIVAAVMLSLLACGPAL
jgi:hypothetical protein